MYVCMYVRVPDLTVQLASLQMCFSLEECSVVVFSAVMTLLPYLLFQTPHTIRKYITLYNSCIVCMRRTSSTYMQIIYMSSV